MYVIFDMDGVIVDSEMVYRRGHMNAARLYGLPEDAMREASERVVGVTIDLERKIMIDTFGSYPQFDVDKMFRACRQYFAYIVETGKMELKPGAVEILRSLKERGVVLGLASSSRDVIDKELGQYGVLQCFDTVVSGDMVKRGKPDPEIFLLCAAKLGIPEEEFGEVYVIEDSYNGVRAAHAAGMQAIMVPDILPPTEEMYGLAVAVLPSLADVDEWLAQSGCPGVFVAFNRKVMLGCRASKVRSLSFDAFDSINCENMAEISSIGMKINERMVPKKKGVFRLQDRYCANVAVLKLFPGMHRKVLKMYAERGYRAFYIEAFGLSRMNMGGMGTKMMRAIMKDKNIDSLEDMMKKAMENGVRIVACSMSMDVMGIRKEELIDGVEIGGVGTYLADAEESNVNLFI